MRTGGHRDQTLRWAGLSAWAGLLAWPFMGTSRAGLLAAALFIGGLVWHGILQAAGSVPFRRFGSAFRNTLPAGALRRPSGVSRGVWIGLALAGLAGLPAVLNNYIIDVLTLAGLYIVLALGLNIVVGMAGLLDLGYVSFYAIGAYTYALLNTHWGVSFWAALPLGGLAAAAVGFLLGGITLRLRGDYLAIVTLGFIQIVNLVLRNWDSVTNGPNGILNIGRPAIGAFVFNTPAHFYYLIIIIAAGAAFLVDRLNRSSIGRAWVAIREDEVAAEAMGVDTTRMKMLAFALGAAVAGTAGVFFAGKFAFISPESFTFFESVIVLAMVVLGGMGSIPGVILGALAISLLPELLRGFSSFRMLLFGALLVLMMTYRPQGIIGNPRRKIELQPEESEGSGRSSLERRAG